MQPASACAPAKHPDRFVDVLLVCAVAGLVAQQWLTTSFAYDEGVLTAAHTFDTTGAATLAWITQLTPLLFFSGGAAAAGGRCAGQVRRLALPVIALLAVWLPLPYLLRAVEAPLRLAWGPVWFVALLVLLTAATPALARLHRRWHGIGVLALAAAAIVTGGGDGHIFVWATAYQAGVAYGCGSLRWAHGRRAVATAGAGVAAIILIVATGPYLNSNVSPPAAVLLAVTMLQLGLALAQIGRAHV